MSPPQIRVDAPIINVTLPRRSVERIPVRDESGAITKIIERDVIDGDGDEPSRPE